MAAAFALLALLLVAAPLGYRAAAVSPPPSSTTPPAEEGPRIVTDQEDYFPGVWVGVTGSGWAAQEEVSLLVEATDGTVWRHSGLAVADAAGGFEYRFTLPETQIATYAITATALSGKATTTFTDSAGSYTVKWYAADPDLNRAPYNPTYTKLHPGDVALPVGRASDPISNAVAYGPTASSLDAVTSLAPPALGLGQIVPFELVIDVTGSTDPESGVITVVPNWPARTTSGSDFGFDPAYGLLAAFVDVGDVGTRDPLENATVSSFSWARKNVGTNNDLTEGSITVSGLDNGDRVVVELWVVLKNAVPAGVSGNVQTSLVSAITGPADGGGPRIPTGNQNVPLLQAGGFSSVSTDLAIAKSDSPDPVLAGQRLTYTLTATNLSTNTVANGMVATDTLDPNTVFVSGSWPDGTCTAAGRVVTCALGSLSPLESVRITLAVDVSPTAPTGNNATTTAATGTCTAAGPGIDLCNLVSITELGTDPNPANNTASAPTNVVTGAVSLAKVSNTGTLLEGAQFRLYTGTPGTPFNPTDPGVEYGAKALYSTDADGRITVTGLPFGPFYFVEVTPPPGHMLNPTPVVFQVSVPATTRVEQVTAVDWEAPTLSKWVTTAGQSADCAPYNTDVTWLIQARVPANVASYRSYVIEDVLDATLAYTGNLRVAVAGTTLTQGTHYTVTSSPAATGGGTLSLALNVTSLGAFSAPDLRDTRITFTARITDRAVMGKGIPNTATLRYDDGISPPGALTSAPARVHTGGKVFIKVAADGTPLPGAQFKVTFDAAGTRFVTDGQGNDVVLTSGLDGRFEIRGLNFDLTSGTDYYLVETRAPTVNGTPYQLMQTLTEFTVTATSYYSNPALVSDPTTPPDATPDQIVNSAAFEIPHTAGIGTLAFSLLGLALMGGAALARR